MDVQGCSKFPERCISDENIITVKEDNKSFSDDDDYQEVITETAKSVSLNVSAILELAHTKIGDVPYSLEVHYYL